MAGIPKQFCTCGGEYKSRLIEKEILYINRSIKVTQIPAYVCDTCGDERIPYKVDKHVHELIRRHGLNESATIAYTEEY